VNFTPSDEYEAFFTSQGDILFLGTEDNAKFVFHTKSDGSRREKVLSLPVLHLISTSPDGQWVIVWIADKTKQAATSVMAYPIAGGNPVLICTGCIGGAGPARDSTPIARWSPDGAFFYFALKAWRNTWAVPVHPAGSLPSLPASGIESEADVARMPGARRLSNTNVSPSPKLPSYAFTRVVAQRNLYRIRIP